MRFSRLVQLHQMCDTIKEAIDYIQQHPNELSMIEMLRSNGIQMIDQIMNSLQRSAQDLKSNRPVELLKDLRILWEQLAFNYILECIEKIQSSLRNDVAYQMRVVFYADVAGKWDVMDTLYREMLADPRFDPVVVLPPIYRVIDENGKKHREDMQTDYLTPMGIPFYHHGEYNLEEDLPEFAFLSQPYESATPPEYWPEYISKYTRLIFLPYYIPFMMLESITHAISQLPVHFYAWKVVAYSKDNADLYTRNSIRQGANLLLTGSTKLDYAVKIKQNRCEVPADWEQKLAGKKAILWSTTSHWELSALPILEELIPWFCNHQEYVLIWRPHPLMEAITKLYYGKYYDRLHKMIDVVKHSDNMIYDDNALYGPSFTASIAQVSEHSTLMIQYLFQNKPVLWIEMPGQTIRPLPTTEKLIGLDWTEKGNTKDQIISFIERSGQQIDLKREYRENLRKEYFPLADGKASVRICNSIWHDVHKEVFPLYNIKT